jgi:2-methylcitrate dehydratase PrpD
LKPARVMVTLKDGRSVTRTCDSPRGDCLNPYTESEIRDKFRALAAPSLTTAGMAVVERAIDACEAWENTGELAALLRRHGLA